LRVRKATFPQDLDISRNADWLRWTSIPARASDLTQARCALECNWFKFRASKTISAEHFNTLPNIKLNISRHNIEQYSS
jgi:hypothetical protein